MKFTALSAILSFLFLFLFTPVHAGEGPEEQCNWLQNIEEAKSTAAKNDLPILISFSGSDWCVPCMRLERDLFTTEDFMEFSNEHLVLLKLDFPARKKNALSEKQLKHNESLAEIYNKRGAFPLVVLTDAQGDVYGFMEHPLTSSEAYIHSIREVISQAEK